MMASTSETGHAKNVASFEGLISVCKAMGTSYNPSKASITITALDIKYAGSDAVLKALNKVTPTLTNAVNEREMLFAPVDALSSRINNAVAASEVEPNVLADVKTITRKLQGRRAKPKKDAADSPGPKNISVSQLSYDSQVENFNKLIELLAAQPGYKPNEKELSVAGLTALYNSMKAANSHVGNAVTAVSNARIARDSALYHPQTGLFKAASDVKSYIKSVFGIKSPQYKQLSNFKFKEIKP